MLLTDRISVFKKLYRAPIDWLEERTTGMADCVLVNSQFTGMINVTWHDVLDLSSNMIHHVIHKNYTVFREKQTP